VEERGAGALEVVLVTPLLFLLIAVVVQFALWYHAAHIAIAAAQDGARAARVEGGTSESGRERAQQVIDQLGTRVLNDATITVTRGPEQARVEVRGWAPELVPGLRLPVDAVSAGATERFRPGNEVTSP